MAARCASCSYPLSVSDSVSCCECSSYFHIDCAQLVGFPYYELSSDPIRNTFHCQTCKILPLPRQSDGFSDSDSDDCTMPSRQLDYHLEGQPDFAKDMNEVKGTVQDLSELCKDMFREISELKSINLTLRCCVENLRQDGEQRDGIISELKRRIEALEGNRFPNMFTPINTTDVYVDRMCFDKEDGERYLTPDPEYCRLKESENLAEEILLSDEIPPADVMENVIRPDVDSVTSDTENMDKIITIQKSIPYEPSTGISHTETSDFDEENNLETNNENVHFAEEETISTQITEDNENDGMTSVKDWDWRGNKAMQLKEDNNYSSVEEEGNETMDIEDTGTQRWEILDEVKKSELIPKHNEETAKIIEELEEEAEEEVIAWADKLETTIYNNEEDNSESQEDIEESVLKSNTEYFTANCESSIESRSIFEGEETEEQKTNEDVAEGAEKTSLKDEEGVEKSKPDEIIEIIEGAEVEDYIKAIYTGRVDSAEGSRLEGEPRLEGDATAEGQVPQGEAEGGQSPENQGEVQPSELSEGSEPPPPQPQHTPDDLWEYLKETVTGEHPATVEEFVQKLIGTLEHVPEEYLKPVIDYNIKRANSPSVTDGEHLETTGDQILHGENVGTEEAALGEAHPQEHGEASPEGGDATAPPSVTQGEGDPSSEPATPLEDTTNLPEETSEPVEGSHALEATS